MAPNTTMWALALTGPSEFEKRVVAAPEASDLQQGQVLLRSLAGGVCGSDLPFYRGRPSPGRTVDAMSGSVRPGYPLHEIVGEVLASADTGIAVGDKVVGWASAMDGMAEYVVSRGSGLHPFSANLLPTTAVMLQPLACVLYAVEQLGDVTGKSTAVLGVGPIGALFTHVLKTRGAAHVVGVDRVDRSDVQGVFGMDAFAHADAHDWAGGLPSNERPDVIVEAIGHQVETLTSAVEALAYEGKIFYFGIPNDDVYPFPMMQFLRKNASLVAGVTAEASRRRVLHEAEQYLAKHPELAEAYLTSCFPYKAAQDAFQAAVQPKTGQMKVTFGLN